MRALTGRARFTSYAMHSAALHPFIHKGLKYHTIHALVRYLQAGGMSDIQPVMRTRQGRHGEHD